MSAKAKRNKYGAKKTPCRHGHIHASGSEAKRCNELHLAQKAGEIRELKQQPKFILQEGFRFNDKAIRAITYTADFDYIEDDPGGWLRVIEEHKGRSDTAYEIRRKMFLNRYCRDGSIFFRET